MALKVFTEKYTQAPHF